jgi:hypothetical protein
MPKFDDPKCPFAVSRPPKRIPVAGLDRFAYLSPVASKGYTATESPTERKTMTLDTLATDDSTISAALAALATEWYGEDAPSDDDLDSLADIIGR